MNGNRIRWAFAALMLILLALFLSSPGLADVEPLPLDMSVHGRELDPAGWISEREYQDESIHIVYETASRKPKSSHETVTCRWVRIKIADPTQLRTVMSFNDYDNPDLERPDQMVKGLNSVVACNDDFMKYSYDFGYVVRQGVFYRNALNGQRDILIIDDKGDFSYVIKADKDSMEEKLSELAAEGRTPVNTFSFGPVLVLDGEAQTLGQEPERTEQRLAAQRVAICQLGELEYAIVEIDGGNENGMNLTELATYITIILPECKIAYNLDGGGSSHLYINGKRPHKTPGSRGISGLIYFVSAVAEAE